MIKFGNIGVKLIFKHFTDYTLKFLSCYAIISSVLSVTLSIKLIYTLLNVYIDINIFFTLSGVFYKRYIALVFNIFYNLTDFSIPIVNAIPRVYKFDYVYA